MSAEHYALRDVTEQDHPWLVELHNDEEVLYNLTDPSPITLESHMRWWNSLDTRKQRRKIFTVNGEAAGFTKFYSIDVQNQNCVLGADLHRSFRGRGLARQMWTLMCDFCFDALDLYRVSLTTAEYNMRAQHVYKQLGFIEEGRLVQSLFRDGKYFDQLCMYLLKPDWKSRRR